MQSTDRLPRANGNAPARRSAIAAPAPRAGTDDALGRLVRMYETCAIRVRQVPVIDRYYVRPLVRNRASYEEVGGRLGIPWWFVGVIHGLESGFSLSSHLHNGDPLTARTVHVPAGRPTLGAPPFTWLESALDAMRLRGLEGLGDWSVGVMLDRLERYNGLGYRNRGLPSPYLWCFSEHYEKGKFVADGRFDPDAVSKQCGGATLIRRLEQTGIVDTAKPLGAPVGASAMRGRAPAPSPAVTRPAAGLPKFVEKWAKAELAFPGLTRRGAKDHRGERGVRRVQEWCSFHECPTMIDGIFGPGTEAAARAFQARAGLPVSGEVDERCWAAMTAPMHAALAPVAVSPEETIHEVVSRIAAVHLAARPVEFEVRGQGNCGPWVRLYMHGREGASQPWCAGFVSHVIGQAAHAMGRPVPIRRRVGVDELVRDAKREGRFLDGTKLAGPGQRRERIPAGALFVVRRTATDWTHVGIVTAVGDSHFSTIEGNTNHAGEREGHAVRARRRAYGKHDFVLLA